MKKYSTYILLLPCTIFLIVTLGFGIGNSLIQSLGFIPSIGLNDFTLKHYQYLFSDESFISSLFFSFKLSFISSIISLIIGVLISYTIYKKHSYTTIKILNIPIIIPHIVVVLIITTLFSQSGILSRLLYNIGIIKSHTSFPLLINDLNGIGIILTYVWKEIPFIALVTYGIMSGIDKNLVYTSKSLGANERSIFFRIILPITKNSLITNYLIIFAFSFASFEVPFLIGPTLPKALSVKAYIEYTSADLFNRPYAMAVNVFHILASLIILLIYQVIAKKTSKEDI